MPIRSALVRFEYRCSGGEEGSGSRKGKRSRAYRPKLDSSNMGSSSGDCKLQTL